MAKRRKKKKKQKREGISVLTMVVLLMVFFAWLSWAIAASAYFGALIEPVPAGGRVRVRTGGIVLMLVTVFNFLINSFRFDALPDVFMNSLRHHRWHFALFVLLEATTVGIGVWLKWLEMSLDRPRVRPRNKNDWELP